MQLAVRLMSANSASRRWKGVRVWISRLPSWVKSTSGETTLAASARPRRADDLLRRGELTLCANFGRQTQALRILARRLLFGISAEACMPRIRE